MIEAFAFDNTPSKRIFKATNISKNALAVATSIEKRGDTFFLTCFRSKLRFREALLSIEGFLKNLKIKTSKAVASWSFTIKNYRQQQNIRVTFPQPSFTYLFSRS